MIKGFFSKKLTWFLEKVKAFEPPGNVKVDF